MHLAAARTGLHRGLGALAAVTGLAAGGGARGHLQTGARSRARREAPRGHTARLVEAARREVRAPDLRRGALVPRLAPQRLAPHRRGIAQHRSGRPELGDPQRQHGDGAGHALVLEARAQPLAGRRRGGAGQRSPQRHGDERNGAAQRPRSVAQRPGHGHGGGERERAQHGGRRGGGVLHPAPQPPEARANEEHRQHAEKRHAQRERRLRVRREGARQQRQPEEGRRAYEDVAPGRAHDRRTLRHCQRRARYVARGSIQWCRRIAAGGPTRDAVELADRLAKSPEVAACTSRQLLSYALGTPLAQKQSCMLDDVIGEGEDANALEPVEIVRRIAVSAALRVRQDGGAQ
ncbi:MAG: DUF1585 domain-containing protein [Polyangiaceae bacterium]